MMAIDLYKPHMTPHRARRVGAIYVVVVMVSLLVASLAMTAISASHAYIRTINSRSQQQAVELAVMGAVERSVAAINATDNWRRLHQNDVFVALASVQHASGETLECRYKIIDSDGDLDDGSQDPCQLFVSVELGDKSFSVSGSLVPNGPPLNCLEYAVASEGTIEVAAMTSMTCDTKIATNSLINAGGILVANCYASGNISGNIYGEQQTLTTRLEFPGDELLSYYQRVGTEISLDSLFQFNGTYVLDYFLLSPFENTLTGQLNPHGIYVIDCGGMQIDIGNCRLQCTLVLVNLGRSCNLEDRIFWEPPSASHPALLADGDIALRMKDEPLLEADANFNFNPPSTPYRGASDDSKHSAYPSQVRGLVYSTGQIRTSGLLNSPRVWGSLISRGGIQGGIKLQLTHRDQLDHPPLGFRDFSKVRLLPGTLRREPTPAQ